MNLPLDGFGAIIQLLLLLLLICYYVIALGLIMHSFGACYIHLAPTASCHAARLQVLHLAAKHSGSMPYMKQFDVMPHPSINDEGLFDHQGPVSLFSPRYNQSHLQHLTLSLIPSFPSPASPPSLASSPPSGSPHGFLEVSPALRGAACHVFGRQLPRACNAGGWHINN